MYARNLAHQGIVRETLKSVRIHQCAIGPMLGGAGGAIIAGRSG
jgi:hypothetical protein